MSERGRFYVYRIFDGEVTVYVGKGSGKRLAAQIRRFCLSGEIVEWHHNEDAAFAAERAWIAKSKPTDNLVAGGNGGRATKKKRPRLHPSFQEIERIGSRVYAARFLLGYCPQILNQRGVLSRTREVANLSMV